MGALTRAGHATARDDHTYEDSTAQMEKNGAAMEKHAMRNAFLCSHGRE